MIVYSTYLQRSTLCLLLMLHSLSCWGKNADVSSCAQHAKGSSYLAGELYLLEARRQAMDARNQALLEPNEAYLSQERQRVLNEPHQPSMSDEPLLQKIINDGQKSRKQPSKNSIINKLFPLRNKYQLQTSQQGPSPISSSVRTVSDEKNEKFVKVWFGSGKRYPQSTQTVSWYTRLISPRQWFSWCFSRNNRN